MRGIASTRTKLLTMASSIAVPDRREGQAAVAHHHGGHAVLRLAGAVGVPEQLRVEMGVMVDEARRHRQALGVDRFRSAVFELAHFDDLAALHPDIGHIGRQTGTVNHTPTANHEIISHGESSF